MRHFNLHPFYRLAIFCGIIVLALTPSVSVLGIDLCGGATITISGTGCSAGAVGIWGNDCYGSTSPTNPMVASPFFSADVYITGEAYTGGCSEYPGSYTGADQMTIIATPSDAYLEDTNYDGYGNVIGYHFHNFTKPVYISATITVTGYIPPWPACDIATFTATGYIDVTDGEGGGCGGSCSKQSAASLSTATVANNDTYGADVRVNLGPSSPQIDGGYLALQSWIPTANQANPALLQVPFSRPNVQVLSDVFGAIQQVASPQGLVNVNVITNYEYHLDCYYATNVGTIGTNGLYSPSGSPFATWVIKNPDGASAHNRLWVTEERGTMTNQYQYTYTSASNRWDLVKPDGQTDSMWLAATTNASVTNYFQQVTFAGHIISQTEKTYQYSSSLNHNFLMQEVDGTNGTIQTTTYSYYPDGVDGSNMVQEVVYPNGNWTYYTYDSLNRKQNEFSAFGNSPPPSTGGPNLSGDDCKWISYSYDSLDALNIGLPLYTYTYLPVQSGGSWSWYEVGNTYHSQLLVINYDPTNALVSAIYDVNEQYVGPTLTLITETTSYATSDYRYGLPFSIIHPDGTTTTIIYPTQDSSVRNDPDGTQTTTITDDWGNPLSVTKVDLATSVVLSEDTYIYTNSSGVYFDELHRSHNVMDLAGRVTSYSYDCCNLDSMTDPDGVTTTYTYDSLKRRVASTVYYGGLLGIETTNVLDAVGHVLVTKRIGTNGNVITLQQTQYDTLGRVARQTNALTGVTITTNFLINSGSQLCVSNTYPDLGTRVETYYSDGRLQSVTGTAVQPVNYVYGVEQDPNDGYETWREYLLTVKLSASLGTNEWTQTFTDGIGNNYETIYAAMSGAPYSFDYYNSNGQLSQRVDPDAISTLYTYDSTGRLSETVADMNQDGMIESDGTDRIILTTNDVSTTDAISGSGVGVSRIQNYVWNPNTSSFQLLSTMDTSANGLTRWNAIWNNGSPVTSKSVTVYDFTGHYRYVTNLAPDGSYTLTTYLYGRLLAMAQLGSDNSSNTQTTYGYDAHGRQNTMTDARNGTTSNAFNNADMVVSVTSPSPGIGGSAQTTLSYFDVMGRLTGTQQPDGTTVTNLYYTTGLLAQTHGSRTYPVGYGYDAQGRMTKTTNWTSFVGSVGTRVTSWIYDAYRGWLDSKHYDNGVGPAYSYTDAGRLADRLWARGTNTAYVYDTAGGLLTTTYDDGATLGITNGYDWRGRLTTISNGPSVCTLTYNDAGQVLSEAYTGGILNLFSITNGYDAFLRRTNNVVLQNGTVLTQSTNTYDAASRLSFISDGNNSATYSYLANSPLVSQIVFAQSGTTRMTTTKSYDYLNRLKGISSENASSIVLDSHGYSYNSANQRTGVTNVDGTYWVYQYDSLGQVTSGIKYWADGTPVAGQQFGYGFDNIGNRQTTSMGGDQWGANLRYATYSANSLNQYTNRTVPGAVDIMGAATNTATVTVNDRATYRKSNYFWLQLALTNGMGAIWQAATNLAVLNVGTNYIVETNINGNVFLPQTPETFKYDADGNLTNDGRWKYFWDAENRLIAQTSLTNAPSGSKLSLSFAYDSKSRRIQKTVSTWTGSSYSPSYTNTFLYDGWNLISEVAPNHSLIRSYLWGSDLSGSMQGAGGVGGMLEVTYSGSSTTNSFATFDGNGNVSSLVNAANATTLAQYEYGPFGEVIRVTGPMAKANPFRFSTKYQDDESDLLYYGFRYYSANEGRWINRDPINEPGFILSTYFVAAFPKIRNDFSYLFVVNDCQDMIDKLGLDGWGSFPPLWNLPPQPPPPPPPAGFFMCQRNIGVDGYSDIAGRVGNCCGGMHTYLEYDDGSGGQWGWGFNGGTTTVSEQHFGGNCTSCKPTSGKLQAGSGQGTAANEATAAQIQDCIKSVKPSKPYSWYGYNCKAWAQEAAGKCGLSCK